MGKSNYGAKYWVGRRIRLTRDVTTVGGSLFKEGSLGRVKVTWRGRFTVEMDEPGCGGEPTVAGGPGNRSISHIAKSTFEEAQEE